MWICMNADSAHCALWWTFSWMLELLENRALENTRNVLSHCFSTRAGYVAGKAGWLSLQVKTLYDCLPWAQHLICLPWIWTMRRGLAESPTLHKLGRSESPKSRVRRECKHVIRSACESAVLENMEKGPMTELMRLCWGQRAIRKHRNSYCVTCEITIANEKKRFSLNFGWFLHSLYTFEEASRPLLVDSSVEF